MQHLGLGTMREVLDRLHVDHSMGVGPRYIGPDIPADQNVFGIGYANISYGPGVYREVVSHPLAEYDSVAEIERNYTWPSQDWYTFDHLPDAVRGHEDWVISGGGYEQFMVYKDLRGVKRAYMDIIDRPEIVHYCMGKLCDHVYEQAARIYEQIPGVVIQGMVAEDLGTQESLLMSLEHIREFMLPHMKRMIDLMHEAGVFVIHHSDGAVRANLPQMIEAGIDILDPVQWRARGMEREGLKRDFGDRLCFHGAMDNQQTLAFGSEEDVKQEVIDNIRILGAGGGFILGPCHNIQVITPPAHVVALYDTAYENGWM